VRREAANRVTMNCWYQRRCEVRVSSSASPVESRAAERRYPTGRERMGSPTLQTLQDSILLWLCRIREAAFRTHPVSQWPSNGGRRGSQYDAVVVMAPTMRPLVADAAELLFRCVAEGWELLATVGLYEPLDAAVLALRPHGAPAPLRESGAGGLSHGTRWKRPCLQTTPEAIPVEKTRRAMLHSAIAGCLSWETHGTNE
jgi:hypothetical protein